jgi:hypothetical protein
VRPSADGEDDVNDPGRLSGRGPLGWWLLLVLVVALAALAAVGRDTPVPALDVTPAAAEPSTPPALTSVRAI